MSIRIGFKKIKIFKSPADTLLCQSFKDLRSDMMRTVWCGFIFYCSNLWKLLTDIKLADICVEFGSYLWSEWWSVFFYSSASCFLFPFHHRLNVFIIFLLSVLSFFKVSHRHLDVLILAFAPCTVTLTHPEDLLDQYEITHDVSRCLALLWLPLNVARWTSAEIREPRWDSQWKLNKNAVTKR